MLTACPINFVASSVFGICQHNHPLPLNDAICRFMNTLTLYAGRDKCFMIVTYTRDKAHFQRCYFN